VRRRDAEPDDGERRPADDEGGGEHGDVVAPAHVDESREDVGEVATTALGHVLAGDVVRAVLVHDAVRPTRREATSARHQRLQHAPVPHSPVPAIRLSLLLILILLIRSGHLLRGLCRRRPFLSSVASCDTVHRGDVGSGCRDAQSRDYSEHHSHSERLKFILSSRKNTPFTFYSLSDVFNV